ncbi:T9SS type A sorting domain-containing protein [Flavilitoribacter nigricans]|uniref:Secretion system C-terminal sorting domain-containing protein n=1 Tax=Flavilitoribacter nigricans (strain ATCC 23147 / DSM 23189 / NBRC 102662 / NCIMB 1420 / SS-2) TaxID=1122177 RepID=A0A2D0N3S2_FLAN2|nr:T9SS type A sorting domain-containing protein [Flavilitoribacter nigricans]PHN03026.1 hypothetical protein CRP01_28490 [Flavilitoribacter nigricans DSM 23189 = NBRC 102662]
MRVLLSVRFWLLWLGSLNFFSASAQFAEPLTFGGAANENGYHLLSDGAGGFFVAGTTDGAFTPAGTPLPVYGQEDFFLGRLDAEGNWLWARSGGSFLNDEIRVMRSMPDGGLLLAGTFWLDFTYDEFELSTSDNIRGAFILRTDALGNEQWGKVINGANLREIEDVKIGPEGQIYLTGYFAETLQFDTLELEARGDNDAFLLKLSPDGELESWQQLGYKGTTRGQTLALHPDGGYYWGGVYDDTLRVDTAELYANTFDRDVFVGRFDGDGNALWAKRAGGVFEEELIAMETDEDGNVVATGFLIGVMTLSETLSVQSRNGNPDIFLFQYDETGAPLWARAIGGNLIDLPTDLNLQEDVLYLSGTYQGSIAWDDLSTPTTGGVNGFVAAFDPASGNSQWLAPVTTEEFVFVEALAVDSELGLFAIGSFTGTARLGSFTVTNPGDYDVFLTAVDPGLTSVFSPEAFPELKLFPNPARDRIYLENRENPIVRLQIYDAAGRKRWERHGQLLSQPLNVSTLEPGLYWLVIHLEEKFVTKSFTIVR